MEDQMIIKKFFERSEEGIDELSNKYGSQCKIIAKRILKNDQDAEECVNDALLIAWNKIPPENPNPLSAYIYRITKNVSLKKYHMNTAKKRNSYYDLALDELSECLSGRTTVEDEILAKELEGAINDFLSELKESDRILFVKRYWFLESIPEIADCFGRSRNYVTVHLHRSREKLKKYLSQRGLML